MAALYATIGLQSSRNHSSPMEEEDIVKVRAASLVRQRFRPKEVDIKSGLTLQVVTFTDRLVIQN